MSISLGDMLATMPADQNIDIYYLVHVPGENKAVRFLYTGDVRGTDTSIVGNLRSAEIAETSSVEDTTIFKVNLAPGTGIIKPIRVARHKKEFA